MFIILGYLHQYLLFPWKTTMTTTSQQKLPFSKISGGMHTHTHTHTHSPMCTHTTHISHTHHTHTSHIQHTHTSHTRLHTQHTHHRHTHTLFAPTNSAWSSNCLFLLSFPRQTAHFKCVGSCRQKSDPSPGSFCSGNTITLSKHSPWNLSVSLMQGIATDCRPPPTLWRKGLDGSL